MGGFLWLDDYFVFIIMNSFSYNFVIFIPVHLIQLHFSSLSLFQLCKQIVKSLKYVDDDFKIACWEVP